MRAAAGVRDNTARGKLLRAFVVPGDAALSVAELRAFVRERISSGLVPNRFELLAAMPLTPSGKLDRRALPASSDADDPVLHVAPRSEFERKLVGLWEEAPEVRPIGSRNAVWAAIERAVRGMAARSRHHTQAHGRRTALCSAQRNCVPKTTVFTRKAGEASPGIEGSLQITVGMPFFDRTIRFLTFDECHEI